MKHALAELSRLSADDSRSYLQFVSPFAAPALADEEWTVLN